ncbi:MAG: hypothetical protein M1827_001368 [Pycnora praestabilis]|nr:MAG: hypothetical protein M1827_001368 [Pycnora praestabilis]
MASAHQRPSSDQLPVSYVAQPVSALGTPQHKPKTSSSASSISENEGNPGLRPSSPRPKFGSRKSSGTIIIPRDTATIELTHEDFDEDDARVMSPRRSSADMEKLGEDARRAMEVQAKTIQASLLALVDRVEGVKSDHDKLEGENKFLQSYIGELMSTSKITSTGAGKSKGRK